MDETVESSDLDWCGGGEGLQHEPTEIGKRKKSAAWLSDKRV